MSEAELTEFSKKEGTKEQTKAWYESHKKDFQSPEKLHARHVLISFTGARHATDEAAKRSKEDARKKADSVLAMIQKDPQKFAEIAKTETDEPSGKTSGGDLGFFTADQMAKEFSDAAFALNLQQVSAVIESPFGFHIIQALEKQEKKEQSFEQAEHSILGTLYKRDKTPKLAEERAKEVLAAVQAHTESALLTQNNLQWESTGLFAINSKYIPKLGSRQNVLTAALSLKNKGDIHAEAISASGKFYIVRLKDRSKADLSKLDEKKKQELARSAAFSEGYKSYTNYEAKVKDDFEKAKLIYINPHYLALDQPQDKQ